MPQSVVMIRNLTFGDMVKADVRARDIGVRCHFHFLKFGFIDRTEKIKRAHIKIKLCGFSLRKIY